MAEYIASDIFFEKNPNPMWIYQPGTLEILAVNDAACRFYGYEKEEMLSMTILDLRPDDEISRLEQHMEQKKEGLNDSGIWIHRKKNGETVHVQILSYSVVWEGRPCTVVVGQDVTRQVDATGELHAAESRFRLLFENSLDGIVIEDPVDGSIIAANEAACDMLDYGPDEVVNLTRFEFLTVDDESFLRVIHDPDEKNYFRGELKLKRRNGELLPVEITTRIRQFRGGEQRAYHIIRDISERWEYEERLEKEREFVSQIVDSLPGIFYMIDKRMNIVRINKNHTLELGYPWEEVQQMHPMEFFHEEDHKRVEEQIAKTFAEGEASMVTRIRRKDGSVGHYYLTGRHVVHEGESYLIGTGIDITERIEVENHVKEALHEKEILLAEVHHRVKNNLAVVSGMMQLQAFKSEDEALRSKLLDSVSRIKSIALIHEYLYQDDALSRIKADSNIRELTKKIGETLNLGITVDYRFELEPITLNVNQAVPFALIINEVVTNIYKHAFRGRDNGLIMVGLKEYEQRISLTIRDDGIGLPEGFDIHSTDTLGMTLINTLARQLDAEVEMESREGETEFRLSFHRTDTIGSSSALAARRA